jgi:Zn-dependent M16 (insulinase) family peptidase
LCFRSLTNQFPSTRKINNADQVEQVRELTKQMRSSDFRERLNGIEEFQKLCELETDTAIQSLVQIFDGFNDCLADMNSKVVLKALNTMHQLVPILGDALSSVINSALPLVAQSIASKNREISQLASDIIDTAIEYIGKREREILNPMLFEFLRLWCINPTIMYLMSNKQSSSTTRDCFETSR